MSLNLLILQSSISFKFFRPANSCKLLFEFQRSANFSKFILYKNEKSVSLIPLKDNDLSLGKIRKGYRAYCAAVLAMTVVLGTGVTAFAASDPITVVNNLSDFIFGLIRAIGMILLGFGIVQVGLSLKSHDPSQRANGFLTLAGGVIITFAKEILTLIAG